MKLNIKKLVLASAVVSFSSFAMAEGETLAERQVKYADNLLADCGIGGAIFKNDIGGVLSNIIWDWGLTATTSYLSSPETCEGKEVQVAKLIHQTYDSFAKDIAVGEGEYLTAALSLYGCGSEQMVSTVAAVRASTAEFIADDSYENSAHDVKAARMFQIVDGAMTQCSA